MKVLITSGGCKVPIDDVRHIGNFSSGKYGKELCNEFTKNGKDVIFFHEKGSDRPEYLYVKEGVVNPTYVGYKDYYDYLKVKDLIRDEQPDLILSAAAISDYIVDKTEGKISSDNDELTIKLKKGEKVLQSFRDLAPKAFIVGFKLLVSPSYEEKYEAVRKQLKYVDAVIYNDLTELRKGDDKRELIFQADEGKIVSAKNMTVSEIVEELSSSSKMDKVFKKYNIEN